jgi:hypothetical protein
MQESLWGNWAPADGGIYHVKYNALSGPSLLQFFDFKTRHDRDVTTFAEHPVLWTMSVAVAPGGREVLFAQLDRAGADILLLENMQ